MVAVATESAPLTADETATLDKLLARASGAPDVRIGEPYVALICLSVPRRGDKDRATDLVHPGEIVHLTDAEALVAFLQKVSHPALTLPSRV